MVLAGLTMTAMPSSAIAVPVSWAASSSFSSRDAMPMANVPSIAPVMPEVESEVWRSMEAFGLTDL